MEFQKTLQLLVRLSVLMFLVVVVLFGSLISFRLKPSLLLAEMPVAPEHWQPKNIDRDMPTGNQGKLIRYGHAIASESPKWIGPLVKDPANQFAGNNLACTNCHLDVGTRAGSASWVGITERFPQFRPRENRVATVEERINGCMERSMNGRKLPEDSRQMKGLVAYMEWLSDDVPEERLAEFEGFPSIELPEMAADTVTGHLLYESQCQTCHGQNGEGIQWADSSKGYQFPPLWGMDTYNHGAGMHRVITATQFIKGNMPFGQATWDNPVLTDEEAYHVAAYINSFERPQKADAENDFPDKKMKPVSTPYGPWDDDFTALQHKYGPFPPIITHYQEKYGITKSK